MTGNCEIGQRPTSNPNSRSLTLDCLGRQAVRSDDFSPLLVQSEISDFGFEVGFCPISLFPIGLLKYVYGG